MLSTTTHILCSPFRISTPLFCPLSIIDLVIHSVQMQYLPIRFPLALTITGLKIIDNDRKQSALKININKIVVSNFNHHPAMLTSIFTMNDPPAFLITSSIFTSASFNFCCPSCLSSVCVVTTYRGGAIRLICNRNVYQQLLATNPRTFLVPVHVLFKNYSFSFDFSTWDSFVRHSSLCPYPPDKLNINIEMKSFT